ncbi:helix-turn-helix transcriptional regulator [Paraburkholderia fungorum]|jgi:prophage regulatory protein|uniref:helix-turn-helix transcriptional regulator n=1 Tax=Paraburkholderia fungorum TaxID=134537 RepID=UPI00041295F8|nr:helix-turn-helix domain-containing protein [Paraburkholderia fungorum]PZR48483.1 MAG: helix-turn-helix domain-containing protein [Paraburkholderia fungorum]
MQIRTMQTLDKAAVCERLNISERTLEGWVRDGRFPAPVRLGKRCYWADEAVQKWHAALFASQLAFNSALASSHAVLQERVSRR